MRLFSGWPTICTNIYIDIEGEHTVECVLLLICNQRSYNSSECVSVCLHFVLFHCGPDRWILTQPSYGCIRCNILLSFFTMPLLYVYVEYKKAIQKALRQQEHQWGLGQPDNQQLQSQQQQIKWKCVYARSWFVQWKLQQQASILNFLRFRQISYAISLLTCH